MKKAPIPKNESQRLSDLYRLELLDTKPEERFDKITRMAVEIFKVKFSTITLVDAKREWYKSCCGCDSKREHEREISFCGHAVFSKNIFIIPDTHKDSRFVDNPMVMGKPFIRFYAGIPLKSPRGERVGVFCIKDVKPRKLSKNEKDILKGLASWAEQELNTHNLRLSIGLIKKVENSGVESELKYKSLLSNIGDGVIAADRNGRVTYLNQVARKTLELNDQRSIGRDISELWDIQTEDGTKLPREKLPLIVSLRTGKKINIDISDHYFCVKKNKTKFPVAMNIAPAIYKKKVVGVVNVFRDITHERDLDKTKTEFVSLISHQLRTPLSVINWYTEMLLNSDAGKLEKKQKQYLEEVYSSGKRMASLINSLLDVSRLEMGIFISEEKQTSLPPIISNILNELKAIMGKKQLNFTKKYDSKLPTIKIDPKLLQVILQNIILNSMNYTPVGGSINLKISKLKKYVQIEISDNGYGIPLTQQPLIFTKLFRADNILKKETKGAGLGLYMVKQLVDRYKGKIWFKSKENVGTTFYVNLPIS